MMVVFQYVLVYKREIKNSSIHASLSLFRSCRFSLLMSVMISFSSRPCQRVFSLFFALTCLLAAVRPVSAAPLFDILYLKSEDLEQVLDYKETLATVFDSTVTGKIKIMGANDEYALVYDGNDSRESLAKTLVSHGDMLAKAGLREPLGIANNLFAPLYNISYGIGPNLAPLEKRYSRLYHLLGDAAENLVIEKTDWGNYMLVLHFRGGKKEATALAMAHKRLLRRQKFSASLTLENGNEVVYGESSHIDDSEEPEIRTAREGSTSPPVAAADEKKTLTAKKTTKYHRQVERGGQVAPRQSLKTETSLEKNIERHISNLRRKGRIRGDEATGWMVYDLAKNQSVVDINANRSFQAASMIKPFVALAFFHKVKAGQLHYGPKSRRQMTLMIQRSNNAATNWVLRQVGGPAACNTLLHKNYPAIFQNTRIREYIPKGGRTYRNTASPADYVRFLKALWDNVLPKSRELRRLMALPGRDRIYNGTPIPRGTLVYNKTGSTAHLIGDMGILVPKTRSGRRYPYIVVGVIERSSRPANYTGWMDSRGDIIREVSTLVYKKMKQQHRLR